MSNYGVTASDILAELRTHRIARAFWTARDMKNVAKDHTDSIRDLRIMLLNLRFPENTFPAGSFAYSAEFTPYIVTVQDNPADNDGTDDGTDNDNGPENLTDSDLAAFADAIADSVTDSTGELITA